MEHPPDFIHESHLTYGVLIEDPLDLLEVPLDSLLKPLLIHYKNYDIARAMSSSRPDPELGHCPGWGYLNI